MGISILTAGAVAVAAQVYLSPIPEVSIVKVFVTYFAVNTALYLYLSSYTPISASIASLTVLNITFLATATLLTLVRRAFFSPLSAFPGPPLYALTNLYKANLYRTGRGAYALLELHDKYNSDVIRLGPNELSVRNVEAVEKLYKGKYPRGIPYDIAILEGATNLNTERDYKIHTPWRRVWDKAFASSQLKDYNPRVEHHVSKLVEVIRKGEGQEVNVLPIFENFVFDIMSDLSFAHDAGMQDGKQENDYMDFIHKYMAIITVIGSLRPIHKFLPYLPVGADVKAHRLRTETLHSNRLKLGKTRKDIFTHLLDAEMDAPEGRTSMFTPAELYCNSNVLIIAGADTTTSTLTRLFRALALHPQILKKLQQEIDEHCASGNEISIESTKNLVYTNAVINESLRLMNPVADGIYAATPPSGITFPVFGNREEKVFIPGNVQVMIPHLALMTDERYFPKGNEFIPERWSGEWDEGVLDRRAFIPFGYGAHSCVGKQLALNEMRVALASLVREWDVVLGERYDENKWREGLKDYHVMKVGDLWGKFVPRA
ncbi:hypothetical protein EG329_004641 [Mollisiaceae sp. DMI_Dod_QoI]|nr:hypothetical protein EG329_004641 [Helotiales sp. DMI_Dod_QoI]